MKHYRITKYDPLNRNEHGHYLYDHWTDIGDIGRILEGELVTKENYLKVEQDYINAVRQIMSDSDQQYLRLVDFDLNLFRESLNENKKEWYHLPIFDEIELHEDKVIKGEEVEIVCQLNFRNYMNTSLEIRGAFYVHFGYDMYMYVGALNISDKLLNELNSTSIFIEEFRSPYYSEDLKYIIEVSPKDSEYVGDQIIISKTIEDMKSLIGLSKDHPGNVHIPLTKELASKLKFDANFSINDYFLTSENGEI